MFPIERVGTERSSFAAHPTKHATTFEEPTCPASTSTDCARNHNATGAPIARLPIHPSPGRAVGRALSLTGVSTVLQAVLLRERGHRSVLLPSLPPSRPSAQTLGCGHRPAAASSGHRPLCHLGARSALDGSLVIDAGTHTCDNWIPLNAPNDGTEKRPPVLAPPHHAIIRPSMIVLRGPSKIVIALT